MGQMNVSITDGLAAYVRRKVKIGRYNNASEVVREALRRMEEEEARAVRLASPTVDDILSDLTAEQLDSIRQHVRAGIEEADAGQVSTYQGRAGLARLAAEVKVEGRRLVAQRRRTR
jgi:antitoxin ParD1/3/4